MCQMICQENRRAQRFLDVLFVVLMTKLQITVCQQTETTSSSISYFYNCNDTDVRQFQENLASKTEITIIIQHCIESCQSMREELFIKATGLERLQLIYRQGEPENDEKCSAEKIILGNNTFAGLHSLQELYMEGFEKTVVDFGVFYPLQNLRSLRLIRFGSERLSYEDLSKAMTAFSGTPLQHIELNGIFSKYSKINIPDIQTLFQIQNVSIKSLAFDNNIVPVMNGRVSKALPDLQVASFSIQFRYASATSFIVDAVTSVQNLEELHIYAYPTSEMASIDYSKFILRGLDYDIKLFEDLDTSCYWNHRAPLSAKLRILKINGVRFLDTRTEGTKICFKDGNVLETLDLSDSPLPKLLPTIQGLKHLKALYARRSGIEQFSLQQLQQIPALRILDFGGNKINENSLQNNLNLSDGQALEVLNLTQCNLYRIPENFTWNLISLRLLDLSQNHLTSADLQLGSCKNLTLLNLSANYIEKLSAFAMTQLKEAAKTNQNFVVDLQRNPLSCLCNATDSVAWMQQMGQQHLYGYDDYMCLHPNGTQVPIASVNTSDIQMQCSVLTSIAPNASCPCDNETLTNLSRIPASLNYYSCQNVNKKLVPLSSLDPDETLKLCSKNNVNVFTSPVFLVPVIVGTALIAILGATFIVLYRLKRRKQTEYLIPECLDPSRIIGTLMALIYKKREGPQEFRYDCFVYFHDDDLFRVAQIILERLSGKADFTTPNDFELGAAIFDEIERCIKQSRWIVFLISQAFVDDGWCKEVVIRTIQRQHAVIPVLLGTLDLKGDEVLASLFNINIPLIWPEDSEYQNQVIQTLLDKVTSDHVIIHPQ